MWGVPKSSWETTTGNPYIVVRGQFDTPLSLIPVVLSAEYHLLLAGCFPSSYCTVAPCSRCGPSCAFRTCVDRMFWCCMVEDWQGGWLRNGTEEGDSHLLEDTYHFFFPSASAVISEYMGCQEMKKRWQVPYEKWIILSWISLATAHSYVSPTQSLYWVSFPIGS